MIIRLNHVLVDSHSRLAGRRKNSFSNRLRSGLDLSDEGVVSTRIGGLIRPARHRHIGRTGETGKPSIPGRTHGQTVDDIRAASAEISSIADAISFATNGRKHGDKPVRLASAISILPRVHLRRKLA